MALPVLDSVFASASDLPRRQMLAKWLVEELGETQSPSDVLVSGSQIDLLSSGEGRYIYTDIAQGKPRYYRDNDFWIEWDNVNYSNLWVIFTNGGDAGYVSSDDVPYPWLAEFNPSAEAGTPILNEIPKPSPLSNYYDLPERYLWAKIAVAAGAPKTEADYISLPKNYAWSDIYNAVAGSSLGTIDWSEKQALGHIAAAYRGDTANPANLATYINWPWRYQVASIITSL